MRIRIGNDIRVAIKLYDKNEKNLNIHSVRAFVISEFGVDKHLKKLCRATRFISRFPIEPAVDCYAPDSHNIHCSGPCVYNQYPKEYYFPIYSGFGVRPNWEHYNPSCGCADEVYEAEVKFTSDNNVIEIIFPADKLIYPGNYHIAIKYATFNPGYRPNDLKVQTTDFYSVFELVENTDDADTFDTDIQVGFPENEYYEEPEYEDDQDLLPDQTNL